MRSRCGLAFLRLRLLFVGLLSVTEVHHMPRRISHFKNQRNIVLVSFPGENRGIRYVRAWMVYAQACFRKHVKNVSFDVYVYCDFCFRSRSPIGLLFVAVSRCSMTIGRIHVFGVSVIYFPLFLSRKLSHCRRSGAHVSHLLAADATPMGGKGSLGIFAVTRQLIVQILMLEVNRNDRREQLFKQDDDELVTIIREVRCVWLPCCCANSLLFCS